MPGPLPGLELEPAPAPASSLASGPASEPVFVPAAFGPGLRIGWVERIGGAFVVVA